MKMLYYLFFSLCLIQFLTVIPYNGFQFFLHILRDGLFSSYKPFTAIPTYKVISKIMAYIYLLSLLIGLLLPLAYKMDAKLKYRLEVVFGSIALIILVLGGRTLKLIFA